ncbi:MAG: mechanosensitive ion channel family protein [Rhodothermaceae bacterium]
MPIPAVIENGVMMEFVNNITGFIERVMGISPELQEKIFSTLLIIVVVTIISRSIKKLLHRKMDDITIRYQWLKIVQYGAMFFILFFVVRIWFGAFESLGTYLGLLSAGLAIAFKDLLVDLAGWFFIMIRKPFRVGDRIQVGEIKGDVIDIRIFQFSVIEIGNWVDADQSTGRIIHIPNSKVFTEAQANYTAGFNYVWHEIPVLFTFESDWKKAKKILFEIVEKHADKFSADVERQIKEAAKKYLIFYNKLTPTVYTTVKDSGVLLTMRYLTEVKKRRSVEENIWESLLDELETHSDIDFAYPTVRYYNNITEGKEGKQ